MKITPEVASVVGPTSATCWGQVILTPGAYGIVEIEDTQDARNRGVRVLSQLNTMLSPLPVGLSQLEEIAGSVMDPMVKTLILFVPVGKVAYMVVRGGGKVFLKRGQQVAELLSGKGSLSGEIALGDTLLLVSSSVAATLSQGELAASFDHLSVREVAEKLTLALHKHEEAQGAAALLFHVSRVESEEIQTPAPQKQPMETIWHGRIREVGQTVKRMPRPQSVIAILLAILFVGSVIVGIQKRAKGVKSNELENVLVEARHLYEEGVALGELNAVKARERLSEAHAMLAPLVESTSERSSAGKEIRVLFDEVGKQLTSSLQVTRGEPVLFFDVSLLKKGATASSISLFEDTVALIDDVGKTAFTLEIAGKKGQIAAGGDTVQNASLVAKYGDALYLLVPGGISKIPTGKVIIEKPSQWGTIESLVAYGGNLYLLDQEKSRIWKYVATESGFSELREYLNPDTLPDFSSAMGMVIDGSVWVGTSDGKILRFTQGRQDSFVPQGVEPPFGKNLVVYTSDEVKYLYVLEPGGKRVVVLDKDGIYVAQYVWEGGITPTQLVVTEGQKKILLLAEGKLYALDLK